MKQAKFAVLTGSAVLAVVLVFALAMPASAQPWFGEMWGSNHDRTFEEMHEECDFDSNGEMHADLRSEMMNGGHGSMMQMHDEMGSNMMIRMHESTHQGCMMGEMHEECDPEMMRDAEHSPMHQNVTRNLAL